MLRKFAISALGAATLLAAPVPALAMPFGNGLPVVKSESVQLIKHRRNRRNRRHSYNRHRRNNNGAAAVAAIIGLGTVWALTNNNQRYAYREHRHDSSALVYSYQPGSPEWIAACARKYRSFEARSGLYTTNSGYKRQCRLP